MVKIKSILKNKTHVETKLVEEIIQWKVENKKLLKSDLHWAFDLGLRENIKQVVTATGWPPGNGMEINDGNFSAQYWSSELKEKFGGAFSSTTLGMHSSKPVVSGSRP